MAKRMDALLSAAAEGDLEALESAVGKNRAAGRLDQQHEGQTALVAALVHGQDEAVKKLLELGADANAPGLGGKPLEVACELGRDGPALTALIAAGADCEGAGPGEETLLMRCTTAAQAEALLAGGANVSARGPDSKTPLHFAAERGRPGVVTALIAGGADPGSRDAKGRYPLHLAKDAPTAKALLSGGAQPGAEDGEGQTALHQAVRRSLPGLRLVKALLKGGVDPNQQDRAGRTALHLALSRARLIKSMVEAGADPALADKDGLTPRAAATSRGHKRAAAFLGGAPAPKPKTRREAYELQADDVWEADAWEEYTRRLAGDTKLTGDDRKAVLMTVGTLYTPPAACFETALAAAVRAETEGDPGAFEVSQYLLGRPELESIQGALETAAAAQQWSVLGRLLESPKLTVEALESVLTDGCPEPLRTLAQPKLDALRGAAAAEEEEASEKKSSKKGVVRRRGVSAGIKGLAKARGARARKGLKKTSKLEKQAEPAEGETASAPSEAPAKTPAKAPAKTPAKTPPEAPAPAGETPPTKPASDLRSKAPKARRKKKFR